MTAIPVNAIEAAVGGSLGTGRRGAGATSFLERALRRLAILPFGTRRRILRLFFDAAAPLIVGRPHPALVTACARTLSLSRKESARFLYRSLLYDALFQMEWLALAYRSKAGLLRDTRYISLDQRLEVEWLAKQDGAVLATMHFGPYSMGLVWLFHHYFAGRTVVILKTRTDDADERAAVARLGELGVDLRFASPDAPDQFFEMVKLVRKGAFAIVMVDLPPDYGRSAPVEALGHTLHFTRGAIDLAAICGVPLVLFRATSDIVRDRIEVADIFEVTRNNERSHEDAQMRVNRFISGTISACPDQWHMWTRFQEFLLPKVIP
jgi:lauroyl/myristoyl acyltransferase